jgi:hypothetical protein
VVFSLFEKGTFEVADKNVKCLARSRHVTTSQRHAQANVPQALASPDIQQMIAKHVVEERGSP